MNLTIHPEAAKNCDKRAEDLLQRLQRAPERFSREPGPSNPNIHSTFTFTRENIIGEMIFGWSDFVGNTVAKAFQQDNELVGLFEDDYSQLIRVAEAIHKSLRPPVVTVPLISNLVFEWVKEAHRKTISTSMTDYVLQECEKRISEAEIWIPISHFFIPHPFVFGRITFRAITKVMMDEWETSALAKCTTDEERTAVKTGMERRRRKFQALATATMKIEAEPDRAYEICV